MHRPQPTTDQPQRALTFTHSSKHSLPSDDDDDMEYDGEDDYEERLDASMAKAIAQVLNDTDWLDVSSEKR